jgi:hypothetical protein
MNRTRTYGLLLAALLGVLFVLGNALTSSPRTLSVFPSLNAIVPFVLVLWPALRAQHTLPNTSITGVIRHGEAITRWASFCFAAFTALASYLYFNAIWITVSISIGTLIATWMIGVLVTIVATGVLATIATRRA